MSPIRLLCALLDARSALPRRDLIARFGASALSTVERSGFARPSSPLTCIHCKMCEMHHGVEVFAAGSGGLRYECVETGSDEAIDPDEIATVAADEGRFIEALRSEIGASRRPFAARALVPGALWRVGEASAATGRHWTCFVATGRLRIESIRAIEEDVGPPGLVLSSSLVGSPTKIGPHRVEHIATLAALREGGLILDESAFRTALGLRSEHPAAGRGRPAAGAAEAIAMLQCVSAEDLALPLPDLLRLLRDRGAPFADWPPDKPPASLHRKIEAAVARERERRFQGRADS